MPAYIHSDRGSSFMSHELKSFLTSLGIATSRTTAYNPEGNGQAERYNGIIWKTVQLALKSSKLAVEQWEEVLQDALHSIRSLLCTSTNATPHERMFTHARRSHNGQSVPTWLSQPGPVLMRNNNRASKYEPLVHEVELIEANPEYAYVRFPDGRETSVSIRHLAPRGESAVSEVENQTKDRQSIEKVSEQSSYQPQLPERANCQNFSSEVPDATESPMGIQDTVPFGSQHAETAGRPVRHKQKPSYLKDYIVN